MYSSLWLEQIENLDKSGKYKQADVIVKKMMKQAEEYAPQIPGESYSQVKSSPQMTQFYTAYRPFAIYLNSKYGIDLFAMPTNLSTLIKATKTGAALPDAALKFPQVFYNDIQAIQGVEDFLKNYPNLYKDLTNINSQIKFLKNKNYWQWLGGIKDSSQFKQELQNLNELKNFAADFYKSENKILNLAKLEADEIKNIKSGFESSKVLNTWNAKMKQLLNNADPNLYNYKNLDNLDNKGLVELIKKTPKLPFKTTIINAVESGLQNETYAQKLIENAEKVGNITKASTEGTEAAGAIAKKFPVLNKILGPLGIILSLPAAFKWTQKILAGDEFTNEEIVECVQDLLNLFAGIAFMIPGGQAVSAVLGGLSLAIMGGNWIAGQFTPAKETKEKQEKDVSDLMVQATPGNFSAFNDFLHEKNLDYNKMKVIDIFNNLEEWIKTGKGTKTFDWFINPTEQNQAKREIFNQRYQNLFNTFRKGGDVTNQESGLAFNSLEDVKKTYDSQFSQNPYIGDAFKQNIPLKEIISKIQKDMAPGMPKGQKWFANVPLNLPDSELLVWYNKSFPDKFLTAQTDKTPRVASTFNLKKHLKSNTI
jgi:hypothetical protein